MAADGVPEPQSHKQELSKLFPNLIGRAAVKLQPTDNSHNAEGAGKLTVGIVLSGGQAPGMLLLNAYGTVPFRVELWRAKTATPISWHAQRKLHTKSMMKKHSICTIWVKDQTNHLSVNGLDQLICFLHVEFSGRKTF